MGFADQYLSRQKDTISHVHPSPSEKLSFIVVIPAYCEPGITTTLDSLWNCQRPHGDVEIIIVVNSPLNADKEILNINTTTINILNSWISNHVDSTMQFLLIHKPNMPIKDAGVGLARKTGMDEAVYRYNIINKPSGYILSLDADCTCDTNYFTAIETAIKSQKNLKAFNLYFEHPVQGNEFSEPVYEGMAHYELHLRYVNQFIRFTGFPFAHHTVGSCFGVRADVYTLQGGMNKRKAGEDFYFLQKIIPLGGFADICTTCVIPSARESFRVPFGTGPAIAKYVQAASHQFPSYSPDCFLSLKEWFDKVPELYRIDKEGLRCLMKHLPKAVNRFLEINNAEDAIQEINVNSASYSTFYSRFFKWFDAFKIVKYLNFSSREYYKQTPVTEGASAFLKLQGCNMQSDGDVRNLLRIFRDFERTD